MCDGGYCLDIKFLDFAALNETSKFYPLQNSKTYLILAFK